MIVLDTERLLFRPHEPCDFKPYCAMEQDAEARRYVGGAPRTRETAEIKFRAMLEPMHDRLGLWATVLKRRAFVDFGFGALTLQRIVATVQTKHKASIRMLEKLGFSLAWREKGHRTFNPFALSRWQQTALEEEL